MSSRRLRARARRFTPSCCAATSHGRAARSPPPTAKEAADRAARGHEERERNEQAQSELDVYTPLDVALRAAIGALTRRHLRCGHERLRRHAAPGSARPGLVTLSPVLTASRSRTAVAGGRPGSVSANPARGGDSRMSGAPSRAGRRCRKPRRTGCRGPSSRHVGHPPTIWTSNSSSRSRSACPSGSMIASWTCPESASASCSTWKPCGVR